MQPPCSPQPVERSAGRSRHGGSERLPRWRFGRGRPYSRSLLQAGFLTAALAACAPTPRPGDAPASERRVTRPALGTLVEVVVREADSARARAAIEATFTEIERLEGLLSEWREGSEISRLNRAAGLGWVALSGETAQALRLARAMAEATGGAFDPTVLPLLRLWGFAGGTPRVPSDAEIAAALPRVDWPAIEIDPRTPRARLRRPGVEVGLGGIGKGFIAEQTLGVLRRAGIGAALVAAAGDLAFYGGTPERPWAIAVEDPNHPGETIAEFELREGGVSTSAPTYRFFEAEGLRFHHLLDPRRGRPARGLRAATVVHPSAARADALATALFVMGERARAYVERHPDFGAILIAESGHRWVSPGLVVRWREGATEPPDRAEDRATSRTDTRR